MWIPKYKRDALKGVDSPIPTQVVSNEEILPRPQNKKQQHVEHLIGEWGAENARRLGMNRRDFMRTSSCGNEKRPSSSTLARPSISVTPAPRDSGMVTMVPGLRFCNSDSPVSWPV